MSDYTITDISVKAYRVDRLVGWLVSVVYFVDISRGWHSQNVKKKTRQEGGLCTCDCYMVQKSYTDQQRIALQLCRSGMLVQSGF